MPLSQQEHRIKPPGLAAFTGIGRPDDDGAPGFSLAALGAPSICGDPARAGAFADRMAAG